MDEELRVCLARVHAARQEDHLLGTAPRRLLRCRLLFTFLLFTLGHLIRVRCGSRVILWATAITCIVLTFLTIGSTFGG